MTQLRVHDPAETSNHLAELRKLADLGVAADNNEPFGDQTWVELRAGHAWLVTTGSPDLTGGAAIVIPEDAEQPVVIELLVAPDERGNGIGRQLVDATKQVLAQHATAQQVITAWSHGDHPAARHLATKAGLEPVRVLYRMALEIDRESFGDVTLPQG